MSSVTKLKTAKIGYIILSVLLCVLGITIIVKPDISLDVIGTVMGATLIVFGIVKIIGYFSKDLYRLAFQYDFAYGLLLIILGAVVIFNYRSLMYIICIATGIAVLVDGLLKLQISSDSRKFGIKQWWAVLLLAIVTAVFGVLLMLFPASSTRVFMTLFGISLLADGLLSLCTVVTAVKIIKSSNPDVIEIEYKDGEE